MCDSFGQALINVYMVLLSLTVGMQYNSIIYEILAQCSEPVLDVTKQSFLNQIKEKNKYMLLF